MVTRLTSAILVSLALLLGFGATGAAAGPSGTYTGKTKGETDVRIKVKNNRITKFESSMYVTCYTGGLIFSYAFPPAGQKGKTIKIKGDGSFKVVFKADPRVSLNDDKRTLKGKFKGGKVSGSMKLEGLCEGDTTFKAHK